MHLLQTIISWLPDLPDGGDGPQGILPGSPLWVHIIVGIVAVGVMYFLLKPPFGNNSES